jgi:hypothetical protein
MSSAPNAGFAVTLLTPSEPQVVQSLAFNPLPPNFANDAAAKAGGLTYGQVYRNGSILQIVSS